MLKQIVKSVLRHTFYREGTIRRIWRGPCKGLRYRIFPEYGLSPLHGGWERDAQALMAKHIRPGAVVYDVGANFGIHTLLMARLAEAGRVYAFEPLPEIFRALQENVQMNGFENVTCVCMALSDCCGTAEFVRGHHGGAGHLRNADGAKGQVSHVQVTSIDEFVYADRQRSPDFLKIDVEGAESQVLSGAARVLNDVRPIVLLDLHTPEQDLAVGRILLAARYDAYRTENGDRVEDIERGWPHPRGLWGQFIAFPR